MRMDYLPDEILGHIFGFVGDKINVSMVCKLWAKILKVMHDGCCDINYNDSYCLKHHLKSSNICIKNKSSYGKYLLNHNLIKNILNHNSLNYIFHVIYNGGFQFRGVVNINDYYELLKQFLITNNISNFRAIKRFITILEANMNNIFNYSYVTNSETIVNMLLVANKNLTMPYISHLLFNDLDNALNTLLNLQNKHIITYAEIYNNVYKIIISNPHKFIDKKIEIYHRIKNEILEYVGKFLDPMIIDFITK